MCSNFITKNLITTKLKLPKCIFYSLCFPMGINISSVLRFRRCRLYLDTQMQFFKEDLYSLVMCQVFVANLMYSGAVLKC